MATRSAARLSLFTIPAVVGIGFLMGVVSNSGFGNPWFDGLVKPPLMPPGWVFGAAWTLLYILLGIALAMGLGAPPSRARWTALALFFVQLALNYSWSPLFFGAHQMVLGLVVILLVLVLSIASAAALRRVSMTGAMLMLPYLAWLCFATYLNFEILRLNPGH